MRVFVGSDHAGFELKAHLLRELAKAGHDVVDVGPAEFDPVDDYPPFCVETGRRTVATPEALGVVIGGSGNGEQIAANKVPGCRAALAWNVETAQLARKHNDAQVVSIGARMHTARGGDRDRHGVPRDGLRGRAPPAAHRHAHRLRADRRAPGPSPGVTGRVAG